MLEEKCINTGYTLVQPMVSIEMKVGPKGQVVIPAVLRREFNIYPGKKIIIQESPQGLLIKNQTPDPLKLFELIAKKKKTKINLHAIEDELEERWKK